MDRSKTESALRRVLEIQRELDVRKELYRELDALTLELRRNGFLREEIDGLVLELKDNFDEESGVNTGWTRSAVKRFEIEVISKELAEKREKREKKIKGVV